MSPPSLRCPATGRLVSEPARDSGCARCEVHLGGRDIPLALYWCGATRTPGAAGAHGSAPATETLPEVDGAAPATPPTPPAQTRFPGYTVERILGRGGGGVVYRVRSQALGRSLALKILNAGPLPSPREHSRFLREIALTRSLDDPGVVRVVDSGVTVDGTPWYAMELVEGTSLAEVLASPLRPPLPALLRVVRDVARTLGRLHRRGVFHRDVKPGNVLITRQGDALLSDFGIALEEEAERLTRTARPVGTPRYMAPEQALCAVEDWKRVDVFALGTLLSDCVAVRQPEDRLPRRLAWVVARATSPRARERHPDMDALAADLDTLQAGRWGLASLRLLGRTMAGRIGRSGVRSILLATLAAALAWPAAARWQASRAETEAWASWSNLQAQLQSLEATAPLPAPPTGQAIDPGDEAESLLRRFAARTEIRGTRARVASIAALADLRRRRGDLALALETALGGLAEARDDTERAEPLRLALEVARQDQRWPTLTRLLTLAETRGWPIDRALRAVADTEDALAFGHLSDPALPAASRALLAPLESGRPVSLSGELRVDLRRPGVDFRVVGVPGLRAPERSPDGWRIPAGWPAWAGEPDGLGALTQAANGDLLALGQSVTRLAPALDATVSDALVVQGRVFLGFTGVSRPLAELRSGQLVGPDPQTEALSFHLLGLDSGDLDGDGRPELIASLGPPHGMMVRAWRLTDAGLERLADRRVGYVRLAGVLPAGRGRPARVVATRENRHPSWPLFGRESPDGGPCALLLLERRGTTFEIAQEQLFRSPTPLCPFVRGAIVDLDRDELADVALSFTDDGGPAPEHTWLYRQRVDGTLAAPLRLGGLRLVAQAPAMGEQGPRLLVRIGPDANRAQLWQTGDGGTALPALPRPAPHAVAPEACGWLFSALGLAAETARACELAATEEPSVAAALVRAGKAWLVAGQPARTLDVLDRMPAGVDDTTATVLRRTAFESLAAADPERAARRPGFVPVSTPEGFRGWLSEVTQPTVRVPLNRSLPDAWAWFLPQAGRHDPLSARLTLRVPSGAGPILRLPLRATGGRIRLHLEGVWQRGEWASHTRILLRPVAAAPLVPAEPDAEALVRGPGLLFYLTTKGGSGTFTRRIDGTCGQVGQRAEVEDDLPFEFWCGTGPEGLLAGHTALGSSAFDIRGPDFVEARPGDPWELVVEGGHPLMDAVGQLTTLSIRRLELGGLQLAPEAPASRRPWVRWALGGALPGQAPEDSAERAQGSVRLGPADVDELALLARLDPTLIHRLMASLGEVAGARVHARAWFTNADVHRDDPETQENLRSPPPTTTLPPATQARLGTAQAAALVASGELQAARQALQRALLLAETGGAEAWRDGFDAAAMSAELALAQDDPETARGSLARALAWAPDEDLGRRLLRHRPRLAPLVGQPGWGQLGPK